MPGYKITVDRDKCTGCGACAAVCNNFKLVDDKSRPIKSEVKEIGCNEEAEINCPVQAITIEEE